MDKARSSSGFLRLPWSLPPEKWSKEGYAKIVNDALSTFEKGDHANSLEVDHLKYIFGLGGVTSRSSKIRCYATHIVWSYRLVDQLSALALESVNLTKDTHVVEDFTEPFRNYNVHLKDWVSLLERSNDARKGSQPKAASFNTCLDRKTDLANRLVSWSKVTGWTSVLCNWVGAALHLCLIIEGGQGIAYSETQLRKSLLELVPPSHLEGDRGVAGFKYPLHLCLAISPLCLFSTCDLSKRSASQDTLFTAWVSLGSVRPTQICQVEQMLWNSLIEIATQDVDVEKCVQGVLENILELGLENESSRSWFFAKGSPLNADTMGGEARQDQVELQAAPTVEESINTDQAPPPYSVSQGLQNHGLTRGDLSDDMDVDTDRNSDEEEEMTGDAADGLGGFDRDVGMAEGDDGPGIEGSGANPPQDPDSDMDNQSDGVQVNANSGSGNQTRGKKNNRRVPSKRKRKNRPPSNLNSSKGPEPAAMESVKRPRLDLTLEVDGLEEVQADHWFGDARPQTFPPINQSMCSEPRIPGEEIQLIDLNIETYRWKPFVHPDNEKLLAHDLATAAKKTYINGEPLYSADEDRSVFCVMSADEFVGKKHLATIFQTQNIVTKQRAPFVETFGLKALTKITMPHKPLWMHDLSDQRQSSQSDQATPIVRGTAAQLLEAHTNYLKNFNVLYCPTIRMPRGEPPCEELSTDSHAFTTTSTMWATDLPYPSDVMTWAFAATHGAHRSWRMSAAGLATRILVKSGVNLWFVAHPKTGKDSSSISFFGGEGMNLNEWDIEVVVLRAGDELYMRPNTPHAVITPESSICYGGYLICHTTIRDTCYGLFHSASRGHVLTNVAGIPEALLLLRRIMMYWASVVPTSRSNPHQPDPETAEGVLDILTVCILAEVGNLLDDRFWKETMEPRERIEVIEARRLSRFLVSWMDGSISLSNKDNTPMEVRNHLYLPFLVHHLLAFQSALQHHAESRQRVGLWSHDTLVDKLEGMYPRSENAHFWELWEKKSSHGIASYSSNIQMEFKVQGVNKLSVTTKFHKAVTGMTPLDLAWAQSLRIDLETVLPQEYRRKIRGTR
ncbi:hypothetical protein BDN72DRAFT_858108 [Pluteus cervinus]|uniref:Uncharacterized protein n=1 Tax=Pluteus cervinus TaxID=181527 RepID=A0ACD3AVA5_9AGAR|nr:hypothetical protein BDN72DRAFT_858108 [Pluteus cervinus]